MAKKVTGIDFPVEYVDRRPGDPPALVSDASKIKEKLNWQPEHDDLEYIIKTAWEWEKKFRKSLEKALRISVKETVNKFCVK